MESLPYSSYRPNRKCPEKIYKTYSIYIKFVLFRTPQKIRLDPLELRRLRFDLVNYYKILSLPQYSYLTNRFNIYHPPSSSRTCLPRLQLPLHATSKLSSSFFYRNIDVFNNLPVDIRTSASLDSFKSNLQKLDLSRFLKCSYLRN